MECPNGNSSYTVEWYGTEDKIKDGLQAFSTESGVGLIADIFFGVKNSIFGKKHTYKCTQCSHIFKK